MPTANLHLFGEAFISLYRLSLNFNIGVRGDKSQPFRLRVFRLPVFWCGSLWRIDRYGYAAFRIVQKEIDG